VAVIVQKYGGSSVADIPRLKRVAGRVVATVREGHRVVVVVSAMGNTTNELLALARRVSPHPGRRKRAHPRERHGPGSLWAAF
jgi:aspartate kinase